MTELELFKQRLERSATMDFRAHKDPIVPSVEAIEDLQRSVNYWGDRCCRAEAHNARLRTVVEVAKTCIIDNRNRHNEDPPRWADCLCGGPKTEELADAIRALEQNEAQT